MAGSDIAQRLAIEAHNFEQLRAATGRLQLTATDRRLLAWLACWDQGTVDACADFFRRLRYAQPPFEE